MRAGCRGVGETAGKKKVVSGKRKWSNLNRGDAITPLEMLPGNLRAKSCRNMLYKDAARLHINADSEMMRPGKCLQSLDVLPSFAEQKAAVNATANDASGLYTQPYTNALFPPLYGRASYNQGTTAKCTWGSRNVLFTLALILYQAHGPMTRPMRIHVEHAIEYPDVIAKENRPDIWTAVYVVLYPR